MTRRVDDAEALRAQLHVTRTHTAWTVGSWEAFDLLPAELQNAAWRQLALEAANHSEGIALYEESLAPAPPPEPAPRRAWAPAKAPRDVFLCVLDDIATEEYVSRLTGEDIHPGRRANCPLPHHDDHSRDFAAYHDRTFNCFGCNRGGTIFQFAAHLWGYNTPLHGDTFREIRDRLHGIFG